MLPALQQARTTVKPFSIDLAALASRASRALLVLVIALAATAASANAQTTIGPFTFTPTSASGFLQGQATLDGTPADAADIVAARDASGNIAGAAQIIVSSGTAFINLPVYGDDATSTGVDEGINGTETFTLLLYDASTQQTIELGQNLSGWTNTNGSPMPGFNDTNTVYAFNTPSAPTGGGSTISAPITVADGTNTLTVNFGIDPSATDGLDSGIDQTAPPAPPAGAFDARFSKGTEAFLTDIRLDNGSRPTGTIEYELSFDGPTFSAISLSWDSSLLASMGSFTMADAVTGTLFGPIDMTQIG
ncbi:MAG: hypothetical protein HKN29_01355, partial [Rhodothermales bacterium]|nr:hypothetical protein [Rhodothermales bacterium]